MSQPLSGSIATPPASADFRKHVHSISRQSFVYLLGTLFTVAAGYLFKIYLARVLGAEGLGIYALGMTAGGFASIVGAAGVPSIASRFVAIYAGSGQTGKLGRFLWLGTFCMLGSNLIVGFGMVVARGWIGNRVYHTPVLAKYMPFFAAIIVTGALTTFLGQALGGYKDVARRTVITSFIGTPATMVFSIVLLSLGYGLGGYLAAQVAAAALVLVLLAISVWKLTPVQARWPFTAQPLVREPWFEREVLSFVAVAAAMQALEFTSGQTDRIVLGIYLTARDVGVYSVAASFVAFVGLFLQAINQIFAPTIAELFSRGEHDLLLRLYQTLTKWTLGLTLPLALTIMIFARPLMGIFGHDFEQGWPVLAISTLGQLISCGVGSVGNLLFMSNQQKRVVRAQIITVFFTLGLNIALIPVCGLIGAAIAAAVTNASLNLLWLRDVWTRMAMFPSRKGYMSLILPTAITAAVLVLVRTFVAGRAPAAVLVAIGLAAGYLVFAGVAVRFSLDPQDKELACDAYARIRSQFADHESR